MPEPISVLHVEDDPRDAELILEELRRSGLDIDARRVASAPELLAALAERPWDVVLCDYQIPGFGAMPALAIVRRSGQDVPFIVVTGTLDEETAVECLKSGIDDYILKENLTRLVPAIRQAIARFEERARSRLLEEEVRQAQKMEAVGRLAGGVAHDFNNLLTIIFANAARLRAAMPAAPELSAELDAIEEAARQAKSVTNSLLALCHKSTTQRSPTDVSAIVHDAARLLRRALPSTIELTVETPPPGSVWVHADPTQLHQVLMNLAINARDAMPAGGVIRFIVRNGHPHPNGRRRRVAEAPPGHVAVSVEDTGAGMSEEIAARAFEPFFTTKPQGQGTGLGLAIVHGIIAEHGGHIELASRPGAGTRVTILLPTTAPPAPVAAPDLPAELPAHLSGRPAIIAEDNSLVRGLLATTLRGLGFRTLEAPDGEEALAAIRATPDAALIILDIDLPKVSGLAALDLIASSPTPIPTLVVTGNPQFALIDGPPAAVLLRKPFAIDEFHAAVIRLLSVNTHLHP